MSCLGNVIWFLFGGFLASVEWYFIGFCWCITIVGIPIGKQCFKLGRLQLAPFGKEVVTTSDSGVGVICNVLWIIFGGLPLAITNLIGALFLALTIVGIPFAVQALKMAQLSLAPFGKEVI